jgi:pyruvate formate lyase activating enzyme
MHKRHTGVSNEKIIENYKALSRLDTTVITRIPLIPTVNDTRENIVATARLMRECGREYIELLPYNKLAGGKYALCGREYKPSFDESMEVEPHIDIFNKYGIEAKIL